MGRLSVNSNDGTSWRMSFPDQRLLPGGPADALAAPLRPRALDTGPTFWLAMFAASAFGTNLGDFWVDGLALDRPSSFAVLASVCLVAVWGDARLGRRTEAFYWVAIVALRAAATNLADFMTHDLAASYLLALVVLGGATLLAGRLTRPGLDGRSPVIDRWYWAAMLAAGVFGTVGGDMASHAMGFYAAAACLSTLLAVTLAIGRRLVPGAMTAYWCAVLAERCAATPVGDALASRHGMGLGLPLAMACTGGAFLTTLLVRQAVGARPR